MNRQLQFDKKCSHRPFYLASQHPSPSVMISKYPTLPRKDVPCIQEHLKAHNFLTSVNKFLTNRSGSDHQIITPSDRFGIWTRFRLAHARGGLFLSFSKPVVQIVRAAPSANGSSRKTGTFDTALVEVKPDTDGSQCKYHFQIHY